MKYDSACGVLKPHFKNPVSQFDKGKHGGCFKDMPVSHTKWVKERGPFLDLSDPTVTLVEAQGSFHFSRMLGQGERPWQLVFGSFESLTG